MNAKPTSNSSHRHLVCFHAMMRLDFDFTVGTLLLLALVCLGLGTHDTTAPMSLGLLVLLEVALLDGLNELGEL